MTTPRSNQKQTQADATANAGNSDAAATQDWEAIAKANGRELVKAQALINTLIAQRNEAQNAIANAMAEGAAMQFDQQEAAKADSVKQ